MEPKENKWKLRELVALPRTNTQIKEGRTSYEQMVGSRYICIREASDGEQGILLKVIGKLPQYQIKVVAGEPFCKDDKLEGFDGDVYYSYRFPTTDEVKEVLGILRENKELLDVFEKASMHINPYSTFWVRETVSKLYFLKNLQYYDSKKDVVLPSTGDDREINYRITIAYF
jgi:hypothetical protein